MRTSSSSTLNHSQMTERLPLSLRESPATLWRKLMSTACFSHLFFFSLTIQCNLSNSWISLFMRIHRTWSCRSDEMITESIIDLWLRVSWGQVQIWTLWIVCSNMMVVMDKQTLAQAVPPIRISPDCVVTNLVTIKVAWRGQWSPRKGHLQSSHAYTYPWLPDDCLWAMATPE